MKTYKDFDSFKALKNKNNMPLKRVYLRNVIKTLCKVWNKNYYVDYE